VFVKDYEVHIEVLRIERAEIVALGAGRGPDPVDILLHFGKCEGAALAYTLVHFVKLFD
jgi:hypothetical protein